MAYHALYPMSDVAITLLAKERKMHADPKRSNASISSPWFTLDWRTGVTETCVATLPAAGESYQRAVFRQKGLQIVRTKSRSENERTYSAYVVVLRPYHTSPPPYDSIPHKNLHGFGYNQLRSFKRIEVY